jgi:hypothetical protein
MLAMVPPRATSSPRNCEDSLSINRLYSACSFSISRSSVFLVWVELCKGWARLINPTEQREGQASNDE